MNITDKLYVKVPVIYSTKYNNILKDYFTDAFTCSVNSLAGLKPGTEWAGTITVVFAEILRAFLAALCLFTKLPKPLT